MISVMGLLPLLMITGAGAHIPPMTIFVALTGAALSTGMT